jgi:hypothetical protein
MPADTQRLAQLNRDGLVSDRDLYLAQDQFTVVEKGSTAARFLLAPIDTLIPSEHVTRLGLVIEGGKIVQDKEAAKGGPEAGVTPQSASEPPSRPVMEAKPGAPVMAGMDVKEEVKPTPVSGPELDPRTGQPKSDPRFQSNSGSQPPKEEARAVPPKAEEKAVKDAEKAKEEEAARAQKAATAARTTAKRR